MFKSYICNVLVDTNVHMYVSIYVCKWAKMGLNHTAASFLDEMFESGIS